MDHHFYKPFRSSRFLSVTVAVAMMSGQLSGVPYLRGLWLFDDENDPGKAAFGGDLIVEGTAPGWAASETHGSATLDGVITTEAGAASRLKAVHDIGVNGGHGSRASEYTLVYDVRRPTGNVWRSFFQTDLGNTSDAEYFTRGGGGVVNSLGRNGGPGYTSFAMPEEQWLRLVISVKLGAGFHSYLINASGDVVHSHSHSALTAVNNEYSLHPEQILFFADNDGENQPLTIGMVAIYDGAMSSGEAAALGAPGTALSIPDPGLAPVLDPGPAGPEEIIVQSAETWSFTATDPENDEVQIQVDWGDGNVTPWRDYGPSGMATAIDYAYASTGSYTIKARARDRIGAVSEWVTMQTVTVDPIPGVPDGLVGLWEFDDENDTMKATHGADLEVIGTAPDFSGTVTDGRHAAHTLEGVITTEWGVGNHLRATHNIGANGGGTQFSNRYTLLYDVLVPGAGAWRSFYQTNLGNSNDAEYFVRNSDNALGVSGLTYSGGTITPNRWHRLVLSVDLADGGHYRAYLDGNLFFTHNKPGLNGVHSLDPAQVLLFADNDGENHPLTIGTVAMFSKALTAEEIEALGGAGVRIITEAENEAPEIVAASAGPTMAEAGEPVFFEFSASDADNDLVQVQADWGDGELSDWSGFHAPGTPLELTHTWVFPATYTIRARARDLNGIVSDWVEIQQIDITGTPQITFSTPPYLQNMSATGMVVMAEVVEPFNYHLEYGTSPAYGASVAMESVASGGGTLFIRGILEDLQPGTTYHYRIATPQGEGITEDAIFRTAPASAWEDFTFGALGDIQTTNGNVWQADPWEPAKTMLGHMADRGVSFGLGLGDHASNGDSYSSTKNSHLNRLAAVLGTRAPFYISWGNHDGNSPSHPLRLSADMPSRHRTDTLSTHTSGFGSFSFVHSGVFFVCLEHFSVFTGTHTFRTGHAENDVTNGWLDARLSSPEARNARFRIVAIHVPTYCDRWIDGNAGLRTHLAPRLQQYNVDLCLSGHMHGYEYGQHDGVHYVTAGGGSYLDFSEPLVGSWGRLGGSGGNVVGTYRRQSSIGVLGPEEPIVGGLFHHYAEFTVRDRYLRMDIHGFNADGSRIENPSSGILHTLEIGGSDPGPDSDGDGIRDAWELANGLDPEDPSDASLDSDGDGQSNLAEYFAGTDPHEASSVFHAMPPALEGGDMEISWSSIPNKRYHLWVSEDLANWSLVETSQGQPLIVTATGSTTTHTISNPFGDRGFVRVGVAR